MDDDYEDDDDYEGYDDGWLTKENYERRCLHELKLFFQVLRKPLDSFDKIGNT